MKKRRFLGHVSSVLQLKAEAEKALDKAIAEGHIHGSQLLSGSVFVTDPGAELFVRGTDHEGKLRTFSFGVSGGILKLQPTGSA